MQSSFNVIILQCVHNYSVGAECFDDEYLDAVKDECKKCKYDTSELTANY